ncbi:hypothetical protein AK830_g4991 [Neonectria ditissima]|uniref:Xylanolytic transcriptional activator regulatory domain-containing protein n=1 Tax=Neonectria ditissima TaxID=78410 RepID=A0A0P7BMA5_9HYPO|nr:hypothetical protein AK830_g4991 [Neonectria ditissima]
MDARRNSSSTASPGPGQQPGRKDRGAIAAQFMVNPSLCDHAVTWWRVLGVSKDKTLVEILDRLTNVENKIDDLSYKIDTSSSSAFDTSQSASAYPANTPLVTELDGQGGQDGLPASSVAPISSTAAPNGGFQYDSSVSKVLEWPAIRQMLDNLEQKPRSPLDELDTSALPEGLRNSMVSLPTDGFQQIDVSNSNVTQEHLKFPGSSNLSTNPPSIEWDAMQRLSKGYFDFFNFLYPLMNRQWFNSNILASIINAGFQEGSASTLALLVFALGEVALSALEAPNTAREGRPSGIKGGTAERPPGITYFNEARKSMGFALTEVSLENVQMLALASLYYGSCGQAVECWRMTVLAFSACQALITRFESLDPKPPMRVLFPNQPSKSNELHGARADLVRRLYWHCSMMDTCLHMEFGLSLTGVEKLDDAIGLPEFSGPMTNDDYIGNQAIHFQEHFACQIVLRRLSASFHQTLSKFVAFGANSSLSFPGLGPYGGSSSDNNMATVKQLAAQLDQWRAMLPRHLWWKDDHVMAFPDFFHEAFGNVYPGQGLQSSNMFTSDLDAPQSNYPYAADIQVALLRTRFYYNKYLIYRPCVFKALHHPEILTHEEADGAAECLKASLKWPIAFSPPCTNKRLIPVAFFWSQNLFGILILLHISQKNPMLQRIRSSLCGQNFDVDETETVNLYLDWLRDIKKIDSTADWCWTVIRQVYQLDEC